jgi:hypothetical protein
MNKIKLPPREQVYFTVMKWSKYHTNGCDLMCSNLSCNRSCISWKDNYPNFCIDCGHKLYAPQTDEY